MDLKSDDRPQMSVEPSEQRGGGQSGRSSILLGSRESGYEYVHLATGLTQDEVYDIILAWLERQHAHISSAIRPSAISAIHGSDSIRGAGYIANKRKYVQFHLATETEGVRIRAILRPKGGAGAVAMLGEAVSSGWELLMLDVWALIDGFADTKRAEEIRNEMVAKAEKVRKTAKRYMLAGLACVATMFLVAFLDSSIGGIGGFKEVVRVLLNVAAMVTLAPGIMMWLLATIQLRPFKSERHNRTRRSLS